MRTTRLSVLLLATLSFAAAAQQAAPLQRASGLWEVKPETSPYSWQICVTQAKDHLIEDDIWSDFDKECKMGAHSREGSNFRFGATCEGDVRMTGTVDGDLASAYKAVVTTSFTAMGKQETQTHVVNGRRLGECPANLEPGAKKMNTGIVTKSIYRNR